MSIQAENNRNRERFPGLEAFIAGGQLWLKSSGPGCLFVPDDPDITIHNIKEWIGRTAEETLYRIKSSEDSVRTAVLGWVWSLFDSAETRNFAVSLFIHHFKTGSSGSQHLQAFLIPLCTIAWALQHEALLMISRYPVQSWSREARNLKQQAQIHREWMEGIQTVPALNQQESAAPSLLTAKWMSSPYPKLLEIPRIMAEEYTLTAGLKPHLEAIRADRDQEEHAAIIIEKIHPPMGIVEKISPSLLRPSIALIEDESLDPSTGIAYNACVILSILQDPRSSPALLRALDRFPVHTTKLRENLLYTLGKLKEPAAVPHIISTLRAPDEVILPGRKSHRATALLREQKEEALRALGTIGPTGLEAVPVLAELVNHPSPQLLTHLAWTLGQLGKTQKETLGGVSADIIITLLRLLKSDNRQLFEEAVHSLRKIEMPEFIHALYLYSVGAVNILALQPAQRGLYELSETLHELIRTQTQAVIAVNGDSGTGKTYFCQSLLQGFGDIRPRDILYLMRDRPSDQKIFNQMLGIKWLSRYIQPERYRDYPNSEDLDDPDAFFLRFLRENREKKLIILDGCRDCHYFQRIIDLFYFQGRLDIEVNFRATLSTRRANLEEREKALESIRNHLSFLEEPPLEDTLFYREGKIILFDLDNSITSRLSREEIQELFSKKRIDNWREWIHPAGFDRPEKSEIVFNSSLDFTDQPVSQEKTGLSQPEIVPMTIRERLFQIDINNDFDSFPNLVETIKVDDIKPLRLKRYAHDQVAGIGKDGTVFVVSFIDNRVFSAAGVGLEGFSLLGRDLFLSSRSGDLMRCSFESRDIRTYPAGHQMISAYSPFSREVLVTGHDDGAIRIWNFPESEITNIGGDSERIISLASDYSGRIYSSSEGGVLARWDLNNSTCRIIAFPENTHLRLKSYPGGKILAYDSSGSFFILDFDAPSMVQTTHPWTDAVSQIDILQDGRIAAALFPSRQGSGGIGVITPECNHWRFQKLEGPRSKYHDCLVMGPRILSCDRDEDADYFLRIWGTEFYARHAAGRLKLWK